MSVYLIRGFLEPANPPTGLGEQSQVLYRHDTALNVDLPFLSSHGYIATALSPSTNSPGFALNLTSIMPAGPHGESPAGRMASMSICWFPKVLIHPVLHVGVFEPLYPALWFQNA